MKRYIKIISLLIIGAALLQLIGYNLFGKRAIHIVCMKNLKTLAYNVDSIGIYSPYIGLSDNEEVEIKDAHEPMTVQFTPNADLFSKRFRYNEKGYGMGYQIEKLNWIKADITEYNGTLYYGEEWESEYVWLFFWWVQVRQENVRQS
jgi:hypothetical protein